MDLLLKNKIMANQKKLHTLLDKKNRTKTKTQINLEDKENKSYFGNKQKEKKSELNILTGSLTTKNTPSISFHTKKFQKSFAYNNQKKDTKKGNLNHTKVNINNFDSNRTENNNELLIYNYNTNLNKINKKNIRNTNISKNETHNYLIKKVKQTKIASQNRKETTDINIRQKKRDENKHIIDISDFDNLNDSLKSSVSIKYMLERFDERERQKKEKIEKLKKLKEEEEKKYYTHIPKICKKTEELTKKIKDDFLTRQKIYNEKKNINEKKLKVDRLYECAGRFSWHHLPSPGSL